MACRLHPLEAATTEVITEEELTALSRRRVDPNPGLVVRVLLCFAVLTLMLLLVAIAGRVALRQSLSATQNVLLHDARVADNGLEVLAATLELRRYEKDVLLNVGSLRRQAEYKEKWTRADTDLVARVDQLDRLITTPNDHNVLREMRLNITSYSEGFERVSSDATTGKLGSRQAANAATEGYKAAVHSIEDVSAAIGATGDRRSQSRADFLRAEAETLLMRVDLVTVAALVLAIGLAIWIIALLRAAG